MNDTFHKFLFLGVMIAVVVFANRGTVAEELINFAYEKNETRIEKCGQRIYDNDGGAS